MLKGASSALLNRLKKLNFTETLWRIRTRPTSEHDLRANAAKPSPGLRGLEELAVSMNSNKFTKWWHYFGIYDSLFDSLAQQSRRNELPQPLRILEIGVWMGGSLQLWRKYFGERSIIFGIDIDEAAARQGVHEAQVRIGSQSDPIFLKSVLDEMGGLDIVIDDGSHRSKDVIASLNAIFPYLSDGGLYIIEDLHTSYWPNFGGGLKRPSSSIEVLKSIIDMLNQPYFGQTSNDKRLTLSPGDIGSIQFFDSVVVIKKAKVKQPAFYLNPGKNVTVD
jgi:cephalosporin hydroxylase